MNLLPLVLIKFSDNFVKFTWGTHVGSYIPFIILNNSIIFPRYRLYFIRQICAFDKGKGYLSSTHSVDVNPLNSRQRNLTLKKFLYPILMVLIYWKTVISFWHSVRVWRRDGQTDIQTDTSLAGHVVTQLDARARKSTVSEITHCSALHMCKISGRSVIRAAQWTFFRHLVDHSGSVQ